MIFEPNTQLMTGGQSFNYSMLSNQSIHNNNNNSSLGGYDHGIEKAKRHYNSEVDPARYRKVLEEGVTKFACSLCGNTYKWRKSLNKHWKEKHITEVPPPLDAPVTVKLRNGNTTINCIAGGQQQSVTNHNHSPVHKSNSENQHKSNWSSSKPLDEKIQKNSTKQGMPNTQASPLPFTPSLLVAAAAAANAATSGHSQMPNGQLHPAYWTVFHQYLNSATNSAKSASDQSAPSKFSISHLTASANSAETPLDLSMKNPAAGGVTTASRRSSTSSSFSNRSSESRIKDEEEEEVDLSLKHRHKKQRHSRRSDYNMQQLLQKRRETSRSSSRSLSASSSIDSSLSAKQGRLFRQRREP